MLIQQHIISFNIRENEPTNQPVGLVKKSITYLIVVDKAIYPSRLY